jgi:hypothetical protein
MVANKKSSKPSWGDIAFGCGCAFTIIGAGLVVVIPILIIIWRKALAI